MRRILMGDLSLPSSRYETDNQRILFHQRALEQIETLPGVGSAGLISSLSSLTIRVASRCSIPSPTSFRRSRWARTTALSLERGNVLAEFRRPASSNGSKRDMRLGSSIRAKRK